MDPTTAAELFLEQNPDETIEAECLCGRKLAFHSHELLVSDYDDEKMYRLKLTHTCQECGESRDKELDITEFVLEQCGPQFAHSETGAVMDPQHVSQPAMERASFTAAYLQLVQIYTGFENGQVDSEKAMALVDEVLDHLESHMDMIAARDKTTSGGVFAEVDDMIHRGLALMGQSSSLLQDYFTAASPGSMSPEEKAHLMQLLEEGNSLVGAGRDKLLQFEEALKT